MISVKHGPVTHNPLDTTHRMTLTCPRRRPYRFAALARRTAMDSESLAQVELVVTAATKGRRRDAGPDGTTIGA